MLSPVMRLSPLVFSGKRRIIARLDWGQDFAKQIGRKLGTAEWLTQAKARGKLVV